MDEQKMNSCDPQDEHKGTVSSTSHSSHSAPTTPSGSLTRQILSLAVPALGALVAAPIFTLIDTAMVGHLGTEELAGLATATTIVQTIVGLFVFLAYSTTALAAQALGAGDSVRAIRSGIEAMWLAAGCGIVTACGLILGGRALVETLGNSPDVMPHALAYLHTASPGLVGMFVVLAATGTLRGLLDTTTPLYVAAGGAALNVALNALFIYGLDMGIAGSGLGTALAQTLMAVVLVAVILSKARGRHVSLRPSGAGIWNAALDGAPLFVRTVAMRIATIATLMVATSISVTALAAHQVVNAVWMFTALALDALAIAAQALVGFDLGAGRREHLRTLLRKLTVWGAAVGLILAVLIAASSPFLPHFFGSDPSMHHIATWALIASACAMPLGGVVFLLDGVLIGAGHGKTLAFGGVFMMVVYLPCLWALERWMAAQRIDDALSPADQGIAMVALWLIFGFVFLGVRGLVNAWRTWWSPRRAIADLH